MRVWKDLREEEDGRELNTEDGHSIKHQMLQLLT